MCGKISVNMGLKLPIKPFHRMSQEGKFLIYKITQTCAGYRYNSLSQAQDSCIYNSHMLEHNCIIFYVKFVTSLLPS